MPSPSVCATWLTRARASFQVIKSQATKLTIWDRNFQLAGYSVALYASMIAYDHATTGRAVGTGWSMLSLGVSALGALGGILVALSVKHTDSIMKSIAVSGAIVLAGVGGWAWLDGPMTLPMALGGAVCIIGTQNYTFDGEERCAVAKREDDPNEEQSKDRALLPGKGGEGDAADRVV